MAEVSPPGLSQQALLERTNAAFTSLIAPSKAPRHAERTVIGPGGVEEAPLEVLQIKEEESATLAVLVNGIEQNIRQGGYHTGEIKPGPSDDVVMMKYEYDQGGRKVVYVVEGTFGSTKTARLTITDPSTSHLEYTEVLHNLGGDTDINLNGPYLDVTQDNYRVSGVQANQTDNSISSALALLKFVPSTSSR